MKDAVLAEFPEVFRGLGCVNRPYKMVLREGFQPMVQPARRVPIALREPLRAELNRLVEAGIVRRVQEPTDWVSGLVIAHKKNGQLRVCLDPRHVNASLKRERFTLPKREEIQAKLAGATYFSTLNANSGFHQIPLDEATAAICTFATPFGRYQYLRMPFGISSAPEVFQRMMSEMLEDLPGTSVYVDDILVWGVTEQEHDDRLRGVLAHLRHENVTLNLEKCRLGLQETVFLGDISKNGIRPSDDLVQTVRNFPAPQNKADVLKFLGLINYFGKYIQNLSPRTVLLRSLVRQESVFEWQCWR